MKLKVLYPSNEYHATLRGTCAKAAHDLTGDRIMLWAAQAQRVMAQTYLVELLIQVVSS